MKLYSGIYEAQALRCLTSKRPEIYELALSRLRKSHLHKKESLEVYDRIMDFYRKHNSMPRWSSLYEQFGLSDKAKTIIESISVKDLPKDIQGLNSLLESLETYRKVRELYNSAKETITKLSEEDNPVDADDLVNLMADTVTKIRADGVAEAEFIHLGVDSNMSEMAEDIIYSENTEHIIPTGFKTFDNVNGGMFRGSFVLLGGSSGSGKSIVCNKLGVNQARLGYKVVTVPLEMTAKEQLTRVISSESGINSIDLILHKAATGEKDLAWKKVHQLDKQIAKNGGKYSVFRPKADMTIEEIFGALAPHRYDVIYLDYVGLLKGVGGDNAWQKLGEVCRLAKIWAENHNCVVVFACQVSEEGRVRYSQTMVEHASLSWIFTSTKETKKLGFLAISMLKARNQQMFDFNLKIEYATSNVRDLEPEEEKFILSRLGKDGGSTTKGKSSKEDSTPMLTDPEDFVIEDDEKTPVIHKNGSVTKGGKKYQEDEDED